MQCCDSRDARSRVCNRLTARGFGGRAELAAGASRPRLSSVTQDNLAYVPGGSCLYRQCPAPIFTGGKDTLRPASRLLQLGRCTGPARLTATPSTMALRAGVLRRAVSPAAPLAGHTAVASAGTAMRLPRQASWRRAHNTELIRAGSRIWQRRGTYPCRAGRP